jgi:hypothetical protein
MFAPWTPGWTPFDEIDTLTVVDWPGARVQVVLDVDEHDVVRDLIRRPQRPGGVGLQAAALSGLLAREPPRVDQRAVVGVDLQQAGGPVRGEVGVPDGVRRLVVGQAHHLGQRWGAEGQQSARVVV